eukprot:CAMPEP_0183438880 /NCGR_PEP_ID=MMETSP0370-20130417/77658_1 /TAXON_ID=268820 /ORGANISM="Peridinium aciculiferum, Strain PAER-2" /LENGTH=232 /DNA_ID=CAMNT_0025627199 /DNA_START=39 /DNA_END=739 /DNA_ORIENTATION=+
MAVTFAFSADSQQLVGLIVNMFGSDKENSLCEMISNAFEKLDRIRYDPFTDAERKIETKPNCFANFVPDRTNSIITIEDLGIGKAESEFVSSLGAIAKSGSKAFREAMAAGVDISVIGQFGVGDALDRISYEPLTDAEKKIGARPIFVMNIAFDNMNSTITIQDFGLGKTRNELLSSSSTIAKSGTEAFTEATAAAATSPSLGGSASASTPAILSGQDRRDELRGTAARRRG